MKWLIYNHGYSFPFLLELPGYHDPFQNGNCEVIYRSGYFSFPEAFDVY